jgi:hypothetical protein
LAFSGLSTETVRELKILDLPELVMSPKLTFTRVPTRIVARPWGLPTVRLLTFLCEEGCHLLVAYLES